MTNTELAELLNSQVGLTGKAAVTADVIRQWVLWDVLPKATAKGRVVGQSPLWNRNERSMRRALRLAELRRQGVRGENEVIAQAYFEWGHSDLDRVREALISVFHRGRAQLTKRITSKTSFTQFAAMSTTRRRALRRQGGPLDQQFVGTIFEQSPEFYITALDAITTGDKAASRMPNLLEQSDLISRANLDEGRFKQLSVCLPAMLNGLFGDEDEITNSGIAILRSASTHDFRVARAIINRYVRTLGSGFTPGRTPPINPLAQEITASLAPNAHQITTGKWAVSAFVAILNAMEKYRGKRGSG